MLVSIKEVNISHNTTFLVTALLRLMSDADLDLHFGLFDSSSNAFSADPCLLYDLLISPYWTFLNLIFLDPYIAV